MLIIILYWYRDSFYLQLISRTIIILKKKRFRLFHTIINNTLLSVHHTPIKYVSSKYRFDHQEGSQKFLFELIPNVYFLEIEIKI